MEDAPAPAFNQNLMMTMIDDDVITGCFKISVDPDQLASLEASLSEATLFSKRRLIWMQLV